jgi:hypothetical protein
MIGVTGSGSAMVEMGVRELRGIKALADGLAEIAAGLPDVEAAADGADGASGGKATAPARIHPPPHRGKGRAKGKQADKPKPAPQPAQGGDTRAARACVVCGKTFHPKTCEKTCSPKCHTERWAEQKRAWAAKHYAGVKVARGKGKGGATIADAIAVAQGKVKPTPPAQVRDTAKRSASAEAIAQAGREARVAMLRSLDPGAADKGQATE